MHYLRIQHAQGTYLSWMKDFVQALAARPAGGRPVALQWEVEHGDTVSIVLVATRAESAPLSERVPLEGWDVHRCAVVVSDLKGSEDRYEIGLFTEPGERAGSNQELLAFGRAHCSGLLAQPGARVGHAGEVSQAERVAAVVIHQIARWVERVRRWGRRSRTVPEGLPERARWVAHRLGLADMELATGLAQCMSDDRDPMEAAAVIWAGVLPWPGVRAGSFEGGSGLPRPGVPVLPSTMPRQA